MKRISVILITGVILSTLLTACGSGGGSNYKASETANESAVAMSDDMYDSYDYAMEEAPAEASGSAGVEKVLDETVSNSNRKIIKNVNLSVETEQFDDFIININAKVTALGGYLENTDISGRSINSAKSMRYASITARIPSNNLDNFVTHVTENSNITNKSESAQDVTLNYADTAAHIKSLRAEQERLDELLLQADDIETIIAIEQRITDVRYELESYESRLRTIDNQVDYSTVYINVHEVERYTPIEEPKQSIGQRIIVGFTENLIDAKDFVVNFFVGLIIAIPILVVVAVFVGIPVIIVVLFVRYIVGKVKGPEYREEQKKKRAEKKAARLQAKANKASKVKKVANSDNTENK